MQTEGPKLPTLLTQEELCSYLGKSKAWAERARLEGNGPPYVKLGRTPRYRLSELEDWIDSNSRKSTSSPANMQGGRNAD